MIQSAALLGGARAEALATIGAIGAGGAVVLSSVVMLFGLGRNWPSSVILERGGLAALAGAPIAVTGVAYANLVLDKIG